MSYFGEDAAYHFISSIIEEKQFNKELAMAKKDNEDFMNYTKCRICYNTDGDADVKVKYHCRITRKYRGLTHRDCNINVKLNHKILIMFHNLKNYDSHLIMQELAKFNFKISVIPKRLEKYMSFIINNKLRFIDSFKFLGSSLDSLVKNLSIDDFKYFRQEFDSNVLDLVKQKMFYLSEYMSDFENSSLNFSKSLILPGCEGNTDIRDICETSLVENYIIAGNIFRYCPLLRVTANTEIFSLSGIKLIISKGTRIMNKEINFSFGVEFPEERFAVYCFNQHCEQCKRFFERKIER